MNSNYYPNYSFDQNSQVVYQPNDMMYRQSQPMGFQQGTQMSYSQDGNMQDDRFFFAPFLVGGLAGTALGYGIANNNQINKGGCCMQPMYFYPQPQMYPYPSPYMYTSNSNNFYY